MTEEYKVGPDVDLVQEELYAKSGRRLAEAYVAEMAERAVQKARGRRSLSGDGTHSPQIA